MTKRIDRWEVCLPEDWPEGYDHVVVCCTVENQKKLLLSAGFFSVKEVWRKKNNVTLLARKGNDLEDNK